MGSKSFLALFLMASMSATGFAAATNPSSLPKRAHHFRLKAKPAPPAAVLAPAPSTSAAAPDAHRNDTCPSGDCRGINGTGVMGGGNPF